MDDTSHAQTMWGDLFRISPFVEKRGKLDRGNEVVELVDALDAWFSQTTAPSVTEVLIQKLFPNSLCPPRSAAHHALNPTQLPQPVAPGDRTVIPSWRRAAHLQEASRSSAG